MVGDSSKTVNLGSLSNKGYWLFTGFNNNNHMKHRITEDQIPLVPRNNERLDIQYSKAEKIWLFSLTHGGKMGLEIEDLK